MSILSTIATLPGVRGATGTVLNALPGYSTLGANISNPNVNYQGKSNPVQAGSGATQPAAQANQQQAPVQNSGALSDSAANGNTTYDPQAAGVYQTQIDQANQQLGTYDGLQNQLLANVNNSYNQGLKSLNDSQAVAQRAYDTNRDSTVQDNVAAKQQIDSSVRSNTNALQRLLGLAGSGNSSAADYANYAAARQGTAQRQQVQNNYAKNLQSLDTSWGDTQQQYNTNLASLADQKKANENSAISGVNANRTSLLSTLAGLAQQKAAAQGQSVAQAQAAANPYVGQIASLNNQAAALAQNYANPTINTQGVAFAAPELSSYATDGGQVQTGGDAVSDTVSPLYYNLLNKNKLTGALAA